MIPYVFIFLYSGKAIPDGLWAFPVVLGLFLAFLSGISLTVGTLNVFFRDVGHVIEPVLNILFYATPIIYSRELFQNTDDPAATNKINLVLSLNPFTHFVEAGRKTVFGGGQISVQEFLILFGLAAVSLTVGTLVYRYHRSKFIFSL